METSERSLRQEIRWVSLACVTIGIIGISLSYLSWRVSTGIDRLHKERSLIYEIINLKGQVVHLDEVLTMSANGAAFSGDEWWEKRYYTHEAKLDSVLARLESLIPPNFEDDYKQTFYSNEELVSAEYETLKLVKEGNLSEAQAILNSDSYQKNKESYTAGITQLYKQLIEDLSLQVTQSYNQVSKNLVLNILFGLCGIAILSSGFFIVLRSHRRDRRSNEELLKNQQLLLDQSSDLQNANSLLESKTRDLQVLIGDLEKAKKAADDANRTKSMFLATMSHEIRTPMNGVIGMASLLSNMELEDEQRECVDTIHQSGEALLTIINDILDFSKIESGEIHLHEEPFSLHKCIEGATSCMAAIAAEKNIDMRFNIEENIPSLLEGDSNRLRQVLLNLLSNALKFTHKGSIIGTCQVLEEKSDSLTIKISVKDTGIGIPADKVESLFDPFTQADHSTTRKYGGTGLGLAISRKLIQAMHGDLKAESVIGKGSTFYFNVNLKKHSQQHQELA